MLGYCVKKKWDKQKNNKNGFILIILGFLFLLCVAFIEHNQLLAGVFFNKINFQITLPYSPPVIVGSILIFIGFTLLDIRNCILISNYTYTIYLIHAGVWSFIVSFILKEQYLEQLDGNIYIIIFTFVVFVISYFLSKIYYRIWNKVDTKKRITNRLLKLFKLPN